MGRFQFSLRMMLAAVAVVGIGAALWTAEPSWQLGTVELSLSVWVLASAVILITHSTGKAKAFWLGVSIECILPIAIHTISVDVSGLKFGGWHFDSFLFNLSVGFRTVLLFWTFAPVVGLLCVTTYWVFVCCPKNTNVFNGSCHTARSYSVMSNSESATLKPRRRWFQYSLRSFFVVVAAVAVWLGIIAHRAREQQEAVRAIEALGGRVRYDWQFEQDDPFGEDVEEPGGPRWLRRAVGDDYFQSVESVNLIAGSLGESQVMALVPSLQRLRWIKRLSVSPDISEAGMKELRTALPNCKIWFPTF